MKNNYQQDIEDENNGFKGDNSICQIMSLDVPYCTNYESSLIYKMVYNYAIPYLTVLIMIGPEILENLKNDQINLWFKHILIVLNKMIINMQTKWVIDLRYKKDQPDEYIGPRLTMYKAYQMNKTSHVCSKI